MTKQNMIKKRRIKRRIKAYFRLTIFLLILIIFVDGFIHIVSNVINKFESNLESKNLVESTIKVTESISYENMVYADDTKNKSFSNIHKPDNMPIEYYELIIYYSNEFDVDPIAIMSLITVENELYNSNASYTNTDGSIDMGLCQINSKYYKEFGKKYNIDNFDPYNPEHAINFMVNHIKYLSNYGKNNCYLNDHDSYLFAAGAYNRGIGNELKYRNMYTYKEKFEKYYNQFSNNLEEM